MTARYRARASEDDIFVSATQWFPAVSFMGIQHDVNADSWSLDGQPVVAGDWIVVDHDGNRTIWRPDVFRDTYEAI